MSDSDLEFFSYLETLLLNRDAGEEEFKSFNDINTFFVQCLVHFRQEDYNFQQQRGEFERRVLRDGVKMEGVVGNFFQKMKVLKRKKVQNRRNMIREAGLNRTQEPTIQTVYLSQLPTSYPPIGHWVADNSTIYNQWNQHLATVKLSDSRHKRYPTMEIDPTQLQLDIKSNESFIICDNDSKEVVGVVVRNFVKNKKLLSWVSEVVQKSVEVTKSVRVRNLYYQDVTVETRGQDCSLNHGRGVRLLFY